MVDHPDSGGPQNALRATAERLRVQGIKAAAEAADTLRRTASPEMRARAEQGARRAGQGAARANRWFWSDGALDHVLSVWVKRSMFDIRQQVAEDEAKVGAARDALVQAQDALGYQGGLAAARNAARARFGRQRHAELLQQARELHAQLPLQPYGAWDDPRWAGWSPDTRYVANVLRVGIQPGSLDATVPVLLPFVGSNRTIIVRHGTASEPQAREVVQSLLLRMALAMPLDLRFTLIDPKTLGRAFPLAGHLPRKRTDDDDLRRLFGTLKAEIRDVATKVLMGADDFESVDPAARQGYQREVVFLTSLGEMQAGDAWLLNDLKQVAGSGPVCGRYLVLMHNSEFELRGTPYDQLGNPVVIDVDEMGPITLDRACGMSRAVELLTRAGTAKAEVAEFGWDQVVGLDPARWWSDSAIREIHTPVGRNRRDVWFGERAEGSCVHGVVAGTAGSGKSKLLHTIIMGLAERYPSSELQMLLMDGKAGVEFQSYRTMPHARVISLRTAPVFALAVLQDIQDQMNERFALFEGDGVSGYEAWRDRNPGTSLPRLVLIADEYQQFFEKDPAVASRILADVSARGRAAGVHMLLASQRFTAPGMTQVDDIMKNMHLRIALRTPDARSLSEFGPRGKAEIEQLDAPGTAVINDRAGADPTSERISILPIPSPQIEALVAAMAARAAADPRAADLPAPVIFNGTDQPAPSTNRALAGLARSGPPDAQRLSALARAPRRTGGLGFSQWRAAEHPVVLWLGQAYAVYGHLPLLLRRSHGQTVLAVGDMGVLQHMLAGALAGLAVTCAPGAVRVDVHSASVPGTSGSGLLDAVCARVLQPAGLAAAPDADPKATLGTYTAELERRKADPQGTLNDPSWLLVLAEPERIQAFRRPERGAAEGSPLRTLLSDGPERGMHVILATPNARSLGQVVDDRRDLQLIDHRVALQMSDGESITILGNREAARLNRVGQGLSAAYLNVSQSSVEFFKPYYMAGDDGDRSMLDDLTKAPAA